MSDSFKKLFGPWLTMTALSLALILIGLYGQKWVKSTTAMKMYTERSDLQDDIQKIVSDIFEHLQTHSFLNSGAQWEAVRLERQVEDLNNKLNKSEGRSARVQTRKEIEETEIKLLNLKKSEVEKFLVSNAGTITNASDYQAKSVRLNEINKTYSHKTTVFYFLLGFCFTIIMCIGLFCLFLFGILGIVPLLNSLK